MGVHVGPEYANVRMVLSLLYWLMIFYLAYDFYSYGIATGNSTLLTVLITIVFIKYVKQHKERQEQTNQPYYENRDKEGFCDNCGVNIDINYGNAYKTLCKKHRLDL